MDKKYNNFLLTLLIFLFALCIRIAYFYFIMDIKSSVTFHEEHDQKLYDSIAMSLLENKEFGVVPGEPIGAVLPIYPLFLAAIYSIFGHSLAAARIMQTLVSSLSCVLGFIIAKKLFNRTTAIFSGLLIAISPPMIYLSGALMNECLFIFIVLLSMFFAIKFTKDYSLRDNVGFSIFLGMSMLTKEIMLPFIVFLIIWYLYLGICNYTKKLLINFFVSNLVIIFLFVPWTIRNHKVYGDFLPTFSMMGGVLWEGNHPSAKGYHVRPQDKDWETIGLKRPRNPIWGSADNLSEAERRRLYTRRTLEWLMKNPKHFLKLIPLKFIYFWGPITKSTSEIAHRFNFFYNIFYSVVLIFAILGTAFSREKLKELLLIYLLFIYFTIVACATVSLTRIRLPLEPFYIILASYSLSNLFLKFRDKINKLNL